MRRLSENWLHDYVAHGPYAKTGPAPQSSTIEVDPEATDRLAKQRFFLRSVDPNQRQARLLRHFGSF